MGRAEPEAQRGAAVPAGAQARFFFGSLRDFLRVLPGAAQRFWFLVFATGLLAGLGSGALLAILGLVQALAWPRAASFVEAVGAASPARRVLVPTAAGVVVGAVMVLWPRVRGGHGTGRIIEAIWASGRELLLGRTLGRALLAITAVGAGASLGREGALVQSGAAAGSWLARRFGLSERQARVLVACGAAAGFAAAYDVPIGGALFGLEVLLGSFALDLLGPIVVSTVVATAVARTLPVPHRAYAIPEYALLRPRELLLGLALAPLLGVAAALYVRVMGAVEARFDRLPRWTSPFLPALGLAAVGALSIRFPALLGNGFDTVHQMLLGGVPLRLLLVLPLLKLLGSAVCAGTGVPGGLFTPSLFYGAGIGAAVGELVAWVQPGSGVPPGALAVVGMAGILAGTTHAVASSVVILFELTGDYGVILPLMASAAVAAVISRAIEPDSLYTASLRRRGVALPRLPSPGWLRATPVTGLVNRDAERIPPTLPFDALVKRLLSLPSGHDLYVTDDQERLLGVIRLDALKGTISDQADLGMIVAADVVDRDVEPLTSTMSLAEVAARFAGTDLERLPVVDGQRRLVGAVSMRDVLARASF
jgi:CIC family chloride channel protein